MPTFSAIALERLIEPGAYKFADKSYTASEYPPLPKPRQVLKPNNVSSNMERTNNGSGLERKSSRPQLTPALYATPDPTPLPDSPSSFPPSPYIVNFKRRGPRLVSISSDTDLASHGKDASDGGAQDPVQEVSNSPKCVQNCTESAHTNGSLPNADEADFVNDVIEACYQPNGVVEGNGDEIDVDKECEDDDFFDPQESMSCASITDVEDSICGSISKPHGSARATEFYDAWDEISSESSQHHLLMRDIEAELVEVRLNLLVEVEKRKEAEEALSRMSNHWQKMRQELSLVGLTLPTHPFAEDTKTPTFDSELGVELGQQIVVARFVANSVGRGTAMAEMEMEMEAKLEAKNFEISRLVDRLHYYEAMNREMSQRNQEAVEVARRNRLLRRRRQRWVWGGIATALSLGSAALAWSYFGSTSLSDNSLLGAQENECHSQ